MFAALLAESLAIYCDWNIKTERYINYRKLVIDKGECYCIWIQNIHGIIVLNNISNATADILYSEYYSYPYIDRFQYDSTIYNSSSPNSSVMAASFGKYYGLVHIEAQANTTVYLTVTFSQGCDNITLSTYQSMVYTFPYNNNSLVKERTYCFMYMAYKADYVGINEIFENGYHNYITLYDGEERCYCTSLRGNGYPFQITCKTYKEGYNFRYNATLNSTLEVRNNELLGTFDDMNNVCKLRPLVISSIPIEMPVPTRSISRSATRSEKPVENLTKMTAASTSKWTIIGISAGSVVFAIIVIGIVYTIVYRVLHPKVVIYINTDANSNELSELQEKDSLNQKLLNDN